MRQPFGLLVALLLGGCSVDTELGVAAEIQSAAVSVANVEDDITVELAMTVEFRVGTYAEGVRTFEVPQADLIVDGRPVVTVNLRRTPGFDYQLDPGEEASADVRGDVTGPLMAEESVLCAGSPVLVLMRWRDLTLGTMGAAFDMTEFSTTDITCR